MAQHASSALMVFRTMRIADHDIRDGIARQWRDGSKETDNAWIHRAERKEVNMMSDSNEASVQSVVVPRPGLFRVFRTSESTLAEFRVNNPPCGNAVVRRFVQIERIGGQQVKKHTLAWFIELTDIMVFVREYGDCVLSVDSDGFNCIEIYDACRE